MRSLRGARRRRAGAQLGNETLKHLRRAELLVKEEAGRG